MTTRQSHFTIRSGVQAVTVLMCVSQITICRAFTLITPHCPQGLDCVKKGTTSAPEFNDCQILTNAKVTAFGKDTIPARVIKPYNPLNPQQSTCRFFVINQGSSPIDLDIPNVQQIAAEMSEYCLGSWYKDKREAEGTNAGVCKSTDGSWEVWLGYKDLILT